MSIVIYIEIFMQEEYQILSFKELHSNWELDNLIALLKQDMSSDLIGALDANKEYNRVIWTTNLVWVDKELVENQRKESTNDLFYVLWIDDWFIKVCFELELYEWQVRHNFDSKVYYNNQSDLEKHYVFMLIRPIMYTKEKLLKNSLQITGCNKKMWNKLFNRLEELKIIKWFTHSSMEKFIIHVDNFDYNEFDITTIEDMYLNTSWILHAKVKPNPMNPDLENFYTVNL